jgi:hypothetical protein
MKSLFTLNTVACVIATSAGAQIGGVPTHDTMKAATLYSACTHPLGETPEANRRVPRICAV